MQITEQSHTDKTPYEQLGGVTVVRQLVDLFYDAMTVQSNAQSILAMHSDLSLSRERFFEFLSGWLGGPQLYIEKHGHPRLRMRHAHVSIGESERDAWLSCMKTALEQIPMADKLRQQLWDSFSFTANFMRNQAIDA